MIMRWTDDDPNFSESYEPPDYTLRACINAITFLFVVFLGRVVILEGYNYRTLVEAQEAAEKALAKYRNERR